LTEHGGANEAANEVAREVHAARGAAIARGGVADKTGRQSLREKRADGHQNHPHQDERQVRRE
jgi:hypothetical protein